jgi:hypothetical protein
MQKLAVKSAIASLGVIGIAMSHQASAQIATAGSGNGSIILAVTDTVTDATYYQILGPTSSFTPTSNASFVDTTIASDPNFQSLLAQAGTDQLAFAVVGGSYTTASPGTNTYLTSTTGGATLSSIPAANLKEFNNVDTNVLIPLQTTSATATSFFAPSGAADDFSATGGDYNGKGPTNETFLTTGTPGTTNLYYLSVSNAKGAAASVSLEGTLTFGTDDSLTFTSTNTAPVPLPAAVWLLGSGLVGLLGIGRRRRALA